jgi:hypothetical protein
LVDGNVVVHTSYLKHLDRVPSRFWVDPLPGMGESFARVEDGSWPGRASLGLQPEQLEELNRMLGGSNPLVPLELEPGARSQFCYICRKKQLLKAGRDARVKCAFCDGFAHAKCLHTEGTTRVVENKPVLFRCNHCVLEMEKTFRFVEGLQLKESRKLAEMRKQLDAGLRSEPARGAAESKG